MDQLVLVQVSDVHFGELFEHPAGDYYPLDRLRAGNNPHAIELCEALTLALADVPYRMGLADGEPFYVLLTGDLSRFGQGNEFSLGHTFFRSRWLLNGAGTRSVGLELSGGRLLTIPGNHDHWNGRRLPARTHNPAIAAVHFRKTPWPRVLFSPGKQLRLELFGLDSNSGFAQAPRRQQVFGWFAGGIVAQQELTALANALVTLNGQALPAGCLRRVRAVLVHHAFTKATAGSVTLALDRGSRSQLLQIAPAPNDIRAVLTGHTHFCYAARWWAPGAAVAHDVWELCSAATLQGPTPTPQQRADPKFLFRQGFWVHQVLPPASAGGRATWNAWRYEWDGSRFVSAGVPWVSFPA